MLFQLVRMSKYMSEIFIYEVFFSNDTSLSVLQFASYGISILRATGLIDINLSFFLKEIII